MENYQFKRIIDLALDDFNSIKIVDLFNNSELFFDKFYNYIIENNLSKNHISLYNKLFKDGACDILQNRMSKMYCSLENLFIDSSIFFFNLSPFEFRKKFKFYINNLKNRKDITDIDTELRNNNSLNYFLDNEMLDSNNPDCFLNSQMISSYSLGIIYLILAEKRELPFFGLPIDEKLIIVHTEEHCTHNEMVYEDNILNFISIFEKNIIYKPSDIILLALLENKDFEKLNLLPQSNSKIIQNWINNLMTYNCPKVIKDNLSIKYQQIQHELVSF